jgi:DNA-binding GntR family transcriptional regulator
LAHRAEDAIRKDIRYHLDVAAALRNRDALAAEHAMRAVLGLFPDSVKGMLLGAFELAADRHSRSAPPA